MPNRVQQDRADTKRREAAEIGAMDMMRLHEGMNKSEASKEKRQNKQPNHATGKRDAQLGGSTSQAQTSTSGSKRRAMAGAGPSEPTRTKATNEGKRATITRETETKGRDTSANTRRNDMDTKVEQKPMKGSAKRAKSST